jgi:hypothetical protein
MILLSGTFFKAKQPCLSGRREYLIAEVYDQVSNDACVIQSMTFGSHKCY